MGFVGRTRFAFVVKLTTTVETKRQSS